MNSEEAEELEIGGGMRAIPLSLGKSSNVETFEEGTLISWVSGVSLNRFALGSSFFIIKGLAMLTVEASTSSGMDATSTTTSKLVASRVDFFRFPPFLIESIAWVLEVEAIWPFKVGSNDEESYCASVEWEWGAGISDPNFLKFQLTWQ
jgi:hypothetical protein